MSVSLALLMAVTAALLAAAVCAVLWRRKPDRPYADAPDPSKAIPNAMSVMDAQSAEVPEYAPPAGSLLAAQLEVGQTFYVQTRNSKYALILRDPINGLYDAVRVGPRHGKVVEERFTMIFTGTFVPNRGLRFREFVPGGNLSYQKIVGADVRHRTTTPILRTLFSIPESYRQAS